MNNPRHIISYKGITRGWFNPTWGGFAANLYMKAPSLRTTSPPSPPPTEQGRRALEVTQVLGSQNQRRGLSASRLADGLRARSGQARRGGWGRETNLRQSTEKPEELERLLSLSWSHQQEVPNQSQVDAGRSQQATLRMRAKATSGTGSVRSLRVLLGKATKQLI